MYDTSTKGAGIGQLVERPTKKPNKQINKQRRDGGAYVFAYMALHSSVVVRKSRWTSWALRP